MDVSPTVKSPPDQLQLALERTYLAHERTLMAWVRTATSLITFGFTLYKFFFYMQTQGQFHPEEAFFGPRTYGLVMMGIGIFALAVATWQHHRMMKRFHIHYSDMPWSLSSVLAGLIAALGILAFLAAVFRL
jgi:putative membrane protein